MNSNNNASQPLQTLVIGSGGRLGQDIMKAFEGDSLTGLNRNELDLSNLSDVESKLENLEFDRVILPASITAVDFCEDHPEEAFRVNSEAPKLIASIAAAKNAHLTYISTDFVFDGNADSPLRETDEANPVSIYGESKLRGEQGVLSVSPSFLVARVAWLFSPSRPAFPEWIVAKAQTEKKLNLPADKIACPTFGPDVAEAIHQLLHCDPAGPAHGVYHVCNQGNCTWQEWGQACLDEARSFGLDLKTHTIGANSMSDIPAFKARRPAYSALNISKLEQFTKNSMRPWKEALHVHFSATLEMAATTPAI